MCVLHAAVKMERGQTGNPNDLSSWLHGFKTLFEPRTLGARGSHLCGARYLQKPMQRYKNFPSIITTRGILTVI